MNISCTNFRCFRNASFRLRPITVLVGENSTGKTSLLALIYSALSTSQVIDVPDFSSDPFQFGTFDQLAFRGARRKKTGSEVTVQIDRAEKSLSTQNVSVYFSSVIEERDSLPAMKSWTMVYSDGNDKTYKVSCTFGSDGSTRFRSNDLDVPRVADLFPDRRVDQIAYVVASAAGMLAAEQDPRQLESAIGSQIPAMSKALDVLTKRDYYVGAPIRSHPQRTYDPTRESRRPDGSSAPHVLAALANSDPGKWAHLSTNLSVFGLNSRLLDGIAVRRMSAKGRASDPFQVEVLFGKNLNNLVDVGYGVSQVLPVLTETLLSKPRSIHLLQQPEVHLHPRAQAELGSYFAWLYNADQKEFIVETHSDFLVDRLRQEVRLGNIAPSDVGIIYFQRSSAGEIDCYQLDLDSAGNVLNAPEGYRSFFLREQMAVLGVDDGGPAATRTKNVPEPRE